MADLSYDDFVATVREAFEVAFDYERDFRAWEEVNLADEINSDQNLENVKERFTQELSKRLDVEIAPEEFAGAKTKLDLLRAADAVVEHSMTKKV